MEKKLLLAIEADYFNPNDLWRTSHGVHVHLHRFS
jgi:hypothetical protein